MSVENGPHVLENVGAIERAHPMLQHHATFVSGSFRYPGWKRTHTAQQCLDDEMLGCALAQKMVWGRGYQNSFHLSLKGTGPSTTSPLPSG